MANNALSLAMLRFLTACMIAVVGMHAFAPIGTPLERRAGSAFSAETHDVSLAGKRKTTAQKAAIAQPDGGRPAGDALPALQPIAPPPPRVASTPVPIAWRPAESGLVIVTGPFGPRGPPLG